MKAPNQGYLCSGPQRCWIWLAEHLYWGWAPRSCTGARLLEATSMPQKGGGSSGNADTASGCVILAQFPARWKLYSCCSWAVGGWEKRWWHGLSRGDRQSSLLLTPCWSHPSHRLQLLATASITILGSKAWIRPMIPSNLCCFLSGLPIGLFPFF